jgi:hypothetical protein
MPDVPEERVVLLAYDLLGELRVAGLDDEVADRARAALAVDEVRNPPVRDVGVPGEDAAPAVLAEPVEIPNASLPEDLGHDLCVPIAKESLDAEQMHADGVDLAVFGGHESWR